MGIPLRPLLSLLQSGKKSSASECGCEFPTIPSSVLAGGLAHWAPRAFGRPAWPPLALWGPKAPTPWDFSRARTVHTGLPWPPRWLCLGLTHSGPRARCPGPEGTGRGLGTTLQESGLRGLGSKLTYILSLLVSPVALRSSSQME